jgi:prepilin peptidase CpaA
MLACVMNGLNKPNWAVDKALLIKRVLDLMGVGAFHLVTYGFGIMAIGLLFYAGLHDFAARTVPNWLPLCILAIGCLLRLADHTIEPGLMIAGATFALLFAVWVLGVMGGGDVKLWAATALLIPPQLRVELNFFMGVFLIGGLLGLVYLALWPLLRRVRRPVTGLRHMRDMGLVRRVLRAEAWRICRRGPLPYALAIAASAILTLLPASLQL